MHLNPLHPNILHDMQAAANGRDLRDGKLIPNPQNIERPIKLVSAKRHLVLRNNYPYSSERQVIRQRIQLVRKQRRISNGR